ncbi:hypothetical protein GIB67_010132 [Kingdonia uniflora]|uniref:Uncharacterized protein n=1 Tax=Kingdonia uniflora TaxID=39325 RepID=A0A7J7NB21_9MAGN|nr:hypothetical protein GIB67_010132 [Kingdonia uniflora]
MMKNKAGREKGWDILYEPVGISYMNFNGHNIRYLDPLIKASDTIQFYLESSKIVDFIKFDVDNVVMVTCGRNMGYAGVI